MLRLASGLPVYTLINYTAHPPVRVCSVVYIHEDATKRILLRLLVISEPGRMERELRYARRRVATNQQTRKEERL